MLPLKVQCVKSPGVAWTRLCDDRMAVALQQTAAVDRPAWMTGRDDQPIDIVRLTEGLWDVVVASVSIDWDTSVRYR